MDQTIMQFTIADRSYRLVIKPEDKELFEESVQQIEIQLKNYAEHFAYNDKQDLLAMVALQFTSESLMQKRGQNDPNQNSALAETLLKIEQAIDEEILKSI
jgi:cell division protein ZapA